MVEASHVILYDKRGRMLLQYRTADAPFCPHMWGIFGGALEDGEDMFTAAQREVKEELNYILKDPRHIITKRFSDFVFHGFVEKFDDMQELTLLEGESMDWFLYDETAKLEIVPQHKVVLEELEEKLKNL